MVKIADSLASSLKKYAFNSFVATVCQMDVTNWSYSELAFLS